MHSTCNHTSKVEGVCPLLANGLKLSVCLSFCTAENKLVLNINGGECASHAAECQLGKYWVFKLKPSKKTL